MTVLGTQSIAACQAHLRKFMPVKNPWPTTDQASLTKFYGAAGDESQLTPLDDRTGHQIRRQPVRVIRCHKKWRTV